MKLVGTIVMTLSVVTGLLSLTTAYRWPVDAGPEAFRVSGDSYAELRAGAGVQSPKSDIPVPLVPADTPLTPEVLERLKAAGVTHVWMKSFRFGSWGYWWIFAFSAAGLCSGAIVLRIAAAQDIEDALLLQATGDGRAGPSASTTLAQIQTVLDGLSRELPTMPSGPSRLHAITSRLAEVQSDHVPAFVEARPSLTGQLGASGYAALMDRFAAAERQINRAWTAAADGAEPEAMASVDRAGPLLQFAAERLDSSKGSA